MGNTGKLTIRKTGEQLYQLDFTTPGYNPAAAPATEPLFFYEALLVAQAVDLGYRNVANEVVTVGASGIAIVGYGGIAARFDVSQLQYITVELGDRTVWPGAAVHPNVTSFDVYYIPESGEAEIVATGVTTYSASILSIETDVMTVMISGITSLMMLAMMGMMMRGIFQAK